MIKVKGACVYYLFVTAGVPLRVLHCVTLTRFVAPRHVRLMGTDTSSLTLVTRQVSTMVTLLRSFTDFPATGTDLHVSNVAHPSIHPLLDKMCPF